MSKVFFGCDYANTSNVLDVRIDDRFTVIDKIYCLVLTDKQELYFASQNEIEYYCKINCVDVVNKELGETEGYNEEPDLYWHDEYIIADCEFWYEYDESENEY